MDRERMDQWLERGILALVLAVMVFAPVATGAVRLQDFAVVQTLIAVASLLWAVRFWVRPSHRIQWPPVCWGALLFAAYGLVRYATADVEYVARLEALRILVMAWLFFIVLNNLHRHRNNELLVNVLLTLGVLLSLYALIQFLSGSNRVLWYTRPEQYAGRGSGTYICPNHLAGLLEMLIPVALAALLLGRGSPVKRVLLGYAVLMMLAGDLATVSRGGYVSCGLALVGMAVFLARYRNFRLPAIGFLVLVFLAGGWFLWKHPISRQRFTEMAHAGRPHDITARWHLTVATARMWFDHWLLGVGPGHFDVRFHAYRPVAIQQRPLWAHNDYLQLLAEGGLVGGVLGIGTAVLLAMGVPVTWRYVRRAQGGLVTKRSDRAAHVLGVSVGLGALAIHTAMDFNLHIPANAAVAVALAASLASHRRFSTRRYWVRLRLPGRILLDLLAVGSAAVLLPQAVRQYREGRALLIARTTPYADEQHAALQEAVRVEPANPESAAKLGEFYRLESWEGGDNWKVLAEAALRWFERSIQLNPFDPHPVLKAGMCLDWLGRHEEAAAYFDRAVQLGPNNYYVALLRGWHEIQVENYPEAKRWLERSIEIKNWANYAAYNYLALVNQRLEEQAARGVPFNQ